MHHTRRPVLNDAALSLGQRGLWALCIGVYLTVFVGGITAGRAIAFTLVTAFLGHTALCLLARASLPVEQGPLATPEGPLGSLVDVVSSTNVAGQEDEAEAA